MAEWIPWSITFFVYVALAAAVRNGVPARARWRVWGGCAAGAALATAAARLPQDGIANTWIVPPVVLLAAYWTTGALFVQPMPRIERRLLAIDTVLRIRPLAARCPRLLAELLELSYAGIYAVVLLALVLARRLGIGAGHFWTVVLVTDFVCFGMLPWIQTRPPRALEGDAPWRSSWRRVNAGVIEAGGLHMNTFPSGHAAEALVVALLLLHAPAWIVALMFVNAGAVSAAIVLGRYHYAADALTGWMVAVCVWWLV